ncbi:MAG: DUF805 domain-containing protein [Enterobacteriaceae bacterium]|jgi:uncharacterized membrane protein YhaH (DUF805 family)|nr:DUF805 domain-containing protein [Enterobacteriaceae bacterium]
MNWYLQVLKNYANFSGRARRKEYWMFYLFNIIVTIAIAVLGSIIDQSIGIVLACLYLLFAFIPGLAVTVRRLHDIDRSGWWFLLAFVPVGGFVLFIFSVLDGTEGSNSYGENPKSMR